MALSTVDLVALLKAHAETLHRPLKDRQAAAEALDKQASEAWNRWHDLNNDYQSYLAAARLLEHPHEYRRVKSDGGS